MNDHLKMRTGAQTKKSEGLLSVRTIIDVDGRDEDKTTQQTVWRQKRKISLITRNLITVIFKRILQYSVVLTTKISDETERGSWRTNVYNDEC